MKTPRESSSQSLALKRIEFCSTLSNITGIRFVFSLNMGISIFRRRVIKISNNATDHCRQKQPLRCLDFRSELHQTSFLDIWAIIIYFPEDPFKTSLPSLSSSSDIITLLRITSTNIIGKIKQMLKPFQSSVLAVRFTPVPLPEEKIEKGLQEGVLPSAWRWGWTSSSKAMTMRVDGRGGCTRKDIVHYVQLSVRIFYFAPKKSYRPQ